MLIVKSTFCFSLILGSSWAFASTGTGVDLKHLDPRCGQAGSKCYVKAELANDSAHYVVYAYDTGADPGGPAFQVAKVNQATHQVDWIGAPFDHYSWDSGASLRIQEMTVVQSHLLVAIQRSDETGERQTNYVLDVDTRDGTFRKVGASEQR